MPGFFDRVKSGAEKAAYEADKLRRVSMAQSALKGLQRDLEAQLAEVGKQVVALYDGGALTQVELLGMCPAIDALRAQIAAQEAEVEHIRQERQPSAAPESAAPPQPPAPAATLAQPRPVVAAPVVPPPQPAAVSPVEEPAPASEAAEGAPAEGPKCPSCGQAVPEGVKFCPECGAKL
ncbi:MAG: zinc ribbon domain-containing protein [Chloroflexota bacterium]